MAPVFTSFTNSDEINAAIERKISFYAHRLRKLLTLTPDDMEDVRQDMRVAVLSALPRFEQKRGCLCTFLDQVIHNTASDIKRKTLLDRSFRKNFYASEVGDDAEEVRLVCDIAGAMVDTIDDTDGCCTGVNATASLDTELALLSFQRNLTLELLVVFRGLMLGLTASQMAQQLGIGESLIRYRVKKLRKQFFACAFSDTKGPGKRSAKQFRG